MFGTDRGFFVLGSFDVFAHIVVDRDGEVISLQLFLVILNGLQKLFIY